jgi:hypothetical protein
MIGEFFMRRGEDDRLRRGRRRLDMCDARRVRKLVGAAAAYARACHAPERRCGSGWTRPPLLAYHDDARDGAGSIDRETC